MLDCGSEVLQEYRLKYDRALKNWNLLGEWGHILNCYNQKRVMRDIAPVEILQQACRVLDCDFERYRIAPRVYGEDKERRDLVVYLLRETGLLTNENIGQLFGFSYSSVSQIVKTVQARTKKDHKFSEKLNRLIEPHRSSCI